MTARSVIIAESATPSSRFLFRSHAHRSRVSSSTSTGGRPAQGRLQTAYCLFQQAQTLFRHAQSLFRQAQTTANATTD